MNCRNIPFLNTTYIDTMGVFSRLCRFEDCTGQVHFGELGNKVPVSEEELVGLDVEVFELGILPWHDEFRLSGKHAKISKVFHQPTFNDVSKNIRF